MYSFVLKIAFVVNRAVELDNITLGFNIANVLELIVEADLIKISVVVNKVLTFYLTFCFSSFVFRYQS